MIQNWLKNNFVAHRGYHNEKYCENTIEAFQNAIDHNYNIELDVQLTRDNVPVVYHDLHLKRLTGKDNLVKELYYKDLQQVKYANGSSIPTFEEVLKVTEKKTGLMIEVKKDNNDTDKVDVEKLILPMLKNYRGDFIVKSFNPFCVNWFHQHSDFSLGFLSWENSICDYAPKTRAAVEDLLFSAPPKVDFFDYFIDKIGSPLWEMVKGKLPAVIWTVHSQADYEKHKKDVVNIIFENFVPKKVS